MPKQKFDTPPRFKKRKKQENVSPNFFNNVECMSRNGSSSNSRNSKSNNIKSKVDSSPVEGKNNSGASGSTSSNSKIQNSAPKNQKRPERLISPSPIANHTKLGRLTAALLKVSHVSGSGNSDFLLPDAIRKSDILCKAFNMKSAKDSIRGNNNNIPPFSPANSTLASSVNTSVSLNSSSHHPGGGAPPPVTEKPCISDSVITNSTQPESAHSDPSDRKTSSRGGVVCGSQGFTIPFPGKSGRNGRFFNIVLPTDRLLRCPESKCRKPIYASSISFAKKALISHLHNSHNTYTEGYYWCGFCKKEIKEKVNTHVCFIETG